MIAGLLQKLTGKDQALTNTRPESYPQRPESNIKMKTFDEFLSFVRPSDHSKYSPSAAERWMECPGSIQASEGIPEETSKYAELGTLAHSYCEAMVRQEFYGIPIPPHLNLQIAQQPDNGAEIEKCASEYVEVISYWLSNPKLGRIIWWGLEKGVPIVPERGCFGTGDCIIVGSHGAAVIDYKHGKGKNVNANTLQLKVYAAGLAQHIQVTPGHAYPITAVVHQPRINDMAKEHEYRHEDLVAFIGDINAAIDKAEGVNPELCDGSHCFWCPARRTKDPSLKCQRIQQKAIDLANENFDKFLSDANHSTPAAAPSAADMDIRRRRDEAIIKLMALMPHIEDVVSNAKEEFMHRLENGENIPGVQIKRKEGSRKINAENTEQAAMLIRQHFPNVNPVETVPAKTKLRTLGSLEKELGKGRLDPLCIRPITKEVDVVDDKTRAILDSMSQFANTIGGRK